MACEKTFSVMHHVIQRTISYAHGKKNSKLCCYFIPATKKHPENQQESSNITSVARYASGLCDTNLQLTVKPLNLFFSGAVWSLISCDRHSNHTTLLLSACCNIIKYIHSNWWSTSHLYTSFSLPTCHDEQGNKINEPTNKNTVSLLYTPHEASLKSIFVL